MDAARLLMIDISGPRLIPEERAFLSERRPGGVCLFGRNVVDRYQVAELVAELRSLAGADLLVAVDQEGGGVVRIPDLPYPPSAMALGAADDTSLTHDVAAATGKGLRAVGINVDFAPVADVNSNPANPVIADRSFGADPQHVARHVAAFVTGLQSAGVAATLKHFPGHGDVDVDSHLDLPTLEKTPEMLERLEWLPFQAGMDAGAAAVMTAHILLPAVDAELPGTLSPAVSGALLRQRLGFGGVVFSDALEMKAIADRWKAPEAAVLAIAAGVDMAAQVGPLTTHRQTVVALEEALAQGRLDEVKLKDSLARLERLSNAFPGIGADLAAAFPEGAEERLRDAARLGSVAIGDLPHLSRGSRVVLVAAGASRQSAATQATVRPAAGLAGELRELGAEVAEIEYRRGEADSAAEAALRAANGRDLLIFASTSRTALGADEQALAMRLARQAPRFLHLALWNPFAVNVVPGPALITFGWRARSLRAAALALFGELVVTGSPPVRLEPARLA
ncbi:MAG TPA: beta-N-acetylhexosaminidase [Trueperaceae bacterium]